MANGDIVRIGRITIGGSLQTQTSTADVPSYTSVTPPFSLIDTDDSTKKWKWLEFTDNGVKKYICTTGIFLGCRYNDLTASFKNVTIEGIKYNFRIPTFEEFKKVYSLGLLNYIDNNSSPSSSYHVITSSNGYTSFLNGSQPNLHSWDIYSFSQNQLVIPLLELSNTAPTISGTDTDLGNKTGSFSVSYSVSDEDNDQEITVTEKLNGATIRTLQNPTQSSTLTFTITDELFSSLSMGATNTIEIEATDGTATSYRRYTFIKTNSAPMINYSGSSDLGQLSSKPTITYSVSDNEGDEITVTEKLNGNIIRTFYATQNTNYTITVSDEFWLSCSADTNTIEISASDVNGGTSYKYITFTRQVNKVQITMKNPIETDAAATKIMVSPDWDKTGCTGTVEVCNNGFDDSPTWEDMTTMVALSRPYLFTNTEKTADKWGIKVRLTLVKNEGYTGEVAIYGFGGAYE